MTCFNRFEAVNVQGYYGCLNRNVLIDFPGLRRSPEPLRSTFFLTNENANRLYVSYRRSDIMNRFSDIWWWFHRSLSKT
jgi:hypothetical protein